MWTSADLKARGKAAFFRNYVAVVIIALVISLASGLLANSYQVRKNINTVQDDGHHLTDTLRDGTAQNSVRVFGATIFTAMMGAFFLAFALISALLKIFIGNIFIIGGYRFMMENRLKNAQMGTVFFGLKSGQCGNIILTMFLRDLFTSLWMLLLIVPGIIKSYEYCMIPYLLSENPRMPRQQAFAISKQMMSGQKMNTFLLDLSFIGWIFLSALTCGLLSLLFTHPYMETTYAELYATLREDALRSGIVNTYDLPGFETMTARY